MNEAKTHAALAALPYVEPGMVIGLGSGSTAKIFVELLAQRVAFSRQLSCVCTSSETQEVAERGGLKIVDPSTLESIDLTVDGADEVSPWLDMIKGGGGAMLRERIAACMSRNHITIVDSSKVHARLGHFPLPIEVAPYGHAVTMRWILQIIADGHVIEWHRIRRNADASVYVTDNGYYILDVKIAEIPDPQSLSDRLCRAVGVADHGLFIGLTKLVICADDGGRITEYR